MKNAVFLDKDGTVIEDLPYNVDPRRIRFLPRAWEGLSLLHEAGFALVMITNQSGVARGYFTEKDLRAVGDYLSGEFDAHGIALSGFYYCPHLAGGAVPEYAIRCACRKPRPGLFLRAARDLGIRLSSSWCIGNVFTDILAGTRAGCRTILLEKNDAHDAPDAAQEWPRCRRCADLAQAAALITTSAATRL